MPVPGYQRQFFNPWRDARALTVGDDAGGVSAVANDAGRPDVRAAAVAGTEASRGSARAASRTTALHAAGRAADDTVAVDAGSDAVGARRNTWLAVKNKKVKVANDMSSGR